MFLANSNSPYGRDNPTVLLEFISKVLYPPKALNPADNIVSPMSPVMRLFPLLKPLRASFADM